MKILDWNHTKQIFLCVLISAKKTPSSNLFHVSPLLLSLPLNFGFYIFQVARILACRQSACAFIFQVCKNVFTSLVQRTREKKRRLPLLRMQINFESKFNGAFTHPIYACVFRIAKHFGITYVGSYMSVKTNVTPSKCNAMEKTHVKMGCGYAALVY